MAVFDVIKNEVSSIFFNRFCDQYVRVNHPQRGIVPFTLMPFQERIAKEMQENQLLIVSKFRMAGLTTLSLAYGLWKSLFTKNYQVCYVGGLVRWTWYLNHFVLDMVDRMPDGMVDISRCTDEVIEFGETGSKMHFLTADAVRGKRMDHIFLDEVAFNKKIGRSWPSIYQSAAEGTKITAVSTPAEADFSNWFYKTVVDSLRGANRWKYLPCHYLEHPDHQNPAWITSMMSSLGPVGFAQEVLGAFLPKHLLEEDLAYGLPCLFFPSLRNDCIVS